MTASRLPRAREVSSDPWRITVTRPRTPRRLEAVPDDVLELQARTLLRRYGVVFRRLLARETNPAPWRDLTRVYRRLEARGEIRGGRFVAGMSGEQFALPEAVGTLRSIRRADRRGTLVAVSAVDSLNVAGLITPGDTVPAVASNRVLFRDGVPLAAREGGVVRPLADYGDTPTHAVEQALIRRPMQDALKKMLQEMGELARL